MLDAAADARCFYTLSNGSGEINPPTGHVIIPLKENDYMMLTVVKSAKPPWNQSYTFTLYFEVAKNSLAYFVELLYEIIHLG